jgi:biopolymer transport protein ExbD
MARKRRQQELKAGELNLTAMIDVAFQLLSFFIITVHPVDVLAHLNVFRPSPEKRQQESQVPVNMIRITILPEGGFTVNDRDVGPRALEKTLTQLAGLDKSQTILIVCTSMSPHSKLIDLLDLCAKVGLINLSVVSAD